MKTIYSIAALLLTGICSLLSAQYKRIYEYNKEKEGWAKVKTVAGTYGFIDKDKKIIVQPIYTKIGKFNEYKQGWALVKNVSNGYGFIDTSGKEIVPANYTLDELKKKCKEQ